MKKGLLRFFGLLISKVKVLIAKFVEHPKLAKNTVFKMFSIYNEGPGLEK